MTVQSAEPQTLTQLTVTGMLISAFQNHCAPLKRGLGLLLVVFIFCGTTVEAAHRHGRILPAPGSATALTDFEQHSTPLATKTRCSDCLICQLHQNFNTSVIAFRVADPPQQVRINVTTVLLLDVLSQITGPTSGRAPPAIS
ncbi:MAG TPA: hypothetical protein VJT69_09655 [Pyrinomonadaceae bacterium]|nr:hypothetical protein [Pyrinomonadaceae bacterium]